MGSSGSWRDNVRPPPLSPTRIPKSMIHMKKIINSISDEELALLILRFADEPDTLKILLDIVRK